MSSLRQLTLLAKKAVNGDGVRVILVLSTDAVTRQTYHEAGAIVGIARSERSCGLGAFVWPNVAVEPPEGRAKARSRRSASNGLLGRSRSLAVALPSCFRRWVHHLRSNVDFKNSMTSCNAFACASASYPIVTPRSTHGSS